MSRFTGEYPPDWPLIAKRIKDENNWCCIRCGHEHDPSSGHTLTIHHATMDKAEPFEHWWAFLALCQKCHLQIQAKVVMERMWVFEHSEWFRPYAAGWYAYKYLGETLSREEVMARLDELLGLERMV